MKLLKKIRKGIFGESSREQKEKALKELDILIKTFSRLNLEYEGTGEEYQDLSQIIFPNEWEEFIPDFFGQTFCIPDFNSTLLFVSAPANKHFPFHYHPQKEWIYILEGEIRVRIKKDGTQFFDKVITAGDVAFFDSMHSHAVDMITNCTYLVQWTPGLDQVSK